MGAFSTTYLQMNVTETTTKELKMEQFLDMSKDQHLMSIRQNGEKLGDIEIESGEITTSGTIGNNTYSNFVELIKGLQGHGIEIDNFYW